MAKRLAQLPKGKESVVVVKHRPHRVRIAERNDEIRRLYLSSTEFTQAQVAARFGLSVHTVQKIING